MQVRENFNMAKSIMIQGTMSNVGKSLLVGGLCRVLKEDGIKVAPFKSQNMALNSFITADGLEMGRAQVMQAEAAMIRPEVYMNPILLKPTSDVGSQVIVNGEVAGVMPAMEYFRKKKEYIPAILEAYHKLEEKAVQSSKQKKILIAPSWQEGNIVDTCLDLILDNLGNRGYQITVRPHPQHVRHRKEYMEQLKHRYADNTDIVIQTDFSSNSTVFEADLMITDWSGIAYEYAYTTQKPVLFINTPMKVMNPEYQKIDVVPLNISLRSEIGSSLDLNCLNEIGTYVEQLLDRKDVYYDKIGAFIREYVYNLGCSASVGGQYIVKSLQDKIRARKGEL